MKPTARSTPETGALDGGAHSEHVASSCKPPPPATSPAPSAMGTNSLNESTICQLLQRIARQDVAAIEELFDGMSREVQQAFRSLSDTPPADPLIEDVFWEIWRTAARFTPDSDSAYRWVIGKVACRVSGLRLTPSDKDERAPERIWHALEQSGSGKAISGIMSGLSVLQLRVSAQCLFLGMSVQQAAEANGIDKADVMQTLATVKTRIWAGMPGQLE